MANIVIRNLAQRNYRFNLDSRDEKKSFLIRAGGIDVEVPEEVKDLPLFKEEQALGHLVIVIDATTVEDSATPVPPPPPAEDVTEKEPAKKASTRSRK